VKKLRVALSDAAIADILEQSDWYETQAGGNLAKRWEEAVTGTLVRIVRNPGAGACRSQFCLGHVRGVALRIARCFHRMKRPESMKQKVC